MAEPELDTGWIVPDWPAPPSVRAGITTRHGGVSLPPYATLNLGDHVGDKPEAVRENRQRLRRQQQLPSEPVWLRQVHGVTVVDAATAHEAPEADASFTTHANIVCAVMTADCLPLLLCNRRGSVVAAAHAGWRGLLDGVIEATVLRMNVAADDLLVWLGPAIGPDAFEVGDEVRDAFIAHDAAASAAFKPSANGRWLANIYQLARQRLGRLGVTAIYGGQCCTWSDAERFYSYRREGVTGRMASLIWRTDGDA